MSELVSEKKVQFVTKEDALAHELTTEVSKNKEQKVEVNEKETSNTCCGACS